MRAVRRFSAPGSPTEEPDNDAMLRLILVVAVVAGGYWFGGLWGATWAALIGGGLWLVASLLDI